MAGKADLVIRFLKAARSLADQGLSKEAIMQFAKNEFGEIGELFQKQIDNIFKPKQGIKNIKMKDPDFDDTVVEMQYDEFGPFNPKDPLKNLKKQTEGIETISLEERMDRIKPKKTDDFNLSEDDPLGDLEKIIKGEGDTGLPKKPRDKKYTGGMVDVEPNLSDIGHGSDALMARTRLVSPNGQATTSTGLNYLLAEDNDNIRVPFQDGLSPAKKIGNILVEDENIEERAGKELLKKLESFRPDETQKEKEERELFKMVKEFQKFKKENPNSRISMSMFRDIKKKEKELFKNTVLELAVKYPEKKIINDAGMVDKKNLKETIDKAEIDLEISPIDGLTLKRSIDTEGDQSVTSGTFDINNFSFSSPNLEEGILTSKGDFNIGDLNLAGTVDSKDSDILKSGITFDYDNMLKGKLSESDGYKEAELGLNKTLPLSNKFNLNLKGDTGMFITPDGKTYKSSELTPKLSYNDGIFNASIAKEIMEGGDKPNLSAGVDFNDFYLKGDNLLSKKDRSGLFGYQKEYGDKDGNLFFTVGGEKDIFDDNYTIGGGVKLKYADGGRIGFSKGKLADAARRKFMKLAGSGAAGLAALKTGLLGFGKEAAPVIEKAVETAKGVPPYFFQLVDLIKSKGREIESYGERVKQYISPSKDGKSELMLTEDLNTGDIQVKKIFKENDDMVTKSEEMNFTKGRGDESTKGTPADDYEEVTEYNSRIYKDDFNDPDFVDGIDVKEIIKEIDVKKASGGLAKMLGE